MHEAQSTDFLGESLIFSKALQENSLQLPSAFTDLPMKLQEADQQPRAE